MGYSDISLAVAFFIGAFHAFWPGHGKALLAAYLVGSRGRVIDAIWLGLVVTVTHTFSVVILGVIIKVFYSAVMTAVIQQRQNPETAEPIPVPGIKIIQLVAGVLILGVGVWLIVSRRRIIAHQHYSLDRVKDQSIRQIIVLGVLGGMIPCAEGIALLLMAISNGQTGRGLTLVLTFSAGVALTIVTIAIIICKLTSVAEALLQRAGRWVDKLPIVSGSLITLLGFYSIIKVLVTL